MVAVDSSGLVGDPPVFMAAVRKVNVQKERIIYLSKNEHETYRKGIEKNWKEKLSAVLMFKAIEPLIKRSDIIQIDKDFTGKKQKYVKIYLRRLFGKKFYGKHPLSNPKIQFIPPKFSEDVKLADKKSKLARHKKIKRHKCPNLWKDLEFLI